MAKRPQGRIGHIPFEIGKTRQHTAINRHIDMVHFDSDHMSGAAKKNTCLEMIDRNGYWWTLYMSLLHYFRDDHT